MSSFVNVESIYVVDVNDGTRKTFAMEVYINMRIGFVRD
jgi:hypothetical protein